MNKERNGAIELCLEKAAEEFELCLEKVGITEPPNADVAIVLDVSGSFKGLHKAGFTNDVMNRFIPWSLVFDPDGQIDVLTFSNGDEGAYHVGLLTAKNYRNYVKDNIIGRVPGYGGGTDYSYVLRKTLQIFGWIEADGWQQSVARKCSWWEKIKKVFADEGSAQSEVSINDGKRKSLVLFITDGENSDETETTRVINEMQKRGDNVFIQFFAFSDDPYVTFRYLRSLEKSLSNVGLHVCEGIKAFVELTNQEINDILIQDKLIKLLKK